MAVIITNMDMPRGCFECPLREEHGWEGDWCAVSEGCDLIGETTRPDYCPLKSADEMTTYYPPCEDCHTKMDEVRRAYDNAMKQEPILDKIRAEIEQARYGLVNDGLDIALNIIDKYKPS